jgi:hypothetical protein
MSPLAQMEALKEAYGDDVDILLIVSRTHYSRTLTTVRASTGAAQSFLAANTPTAGGNVTMEKMLTEGWSASVEQFYAQKGGRHSKKSSKWKKPKNAGEAAGAQAQAAQPPPAVVVMGAGGPQQVAIVGAASSSSGVQGGAQQLVAQDTSQQAVANLFRGLTPVAFPGALPEVGDVSAV